MTNERFSHHLSFICVWAGRRWCAVAPLHPARLVRQSPFCFWRLWQPHRRTTKGFGTHLSCNCHTLLECLLSLFRISMSCFGSMALKAGEGLCWKCFYGQTEPLCLAHLWSLRCIPSTGSQRFEIARFEPQGQKLFEWLLRLDYVWFESRDPRHLSWNLVCYTRVFSWEHLVIFPNQDPQKGPENWCCAKIVKRYMLVTLFDDCCPARKKSKSIDKCFDTFCDFPPKKKRKTQTHRGQRASEVTKKCQEVTFWPPSDPKVAFGAQKVTF